MTGWEGLDPCPCGTKRAPELKLGGGFRFTCPACGLSEAADTLPGAKQAWNDGMRRYRDMVAELRQRLED